MLQAIFYPVQVCLALKTFPGFWQPHRVDSSLCTSLGKGAVCPSAGAPPFSEHHRPQLETGRGSVPTPSKSSSLHHSNAANTTGKERHALLLFSFCLKGHWWLRQVRVTFCFWRKSLSFFPRKGTPQEIIRVWTQSCLPMTPPPHTHTHTHTPVWIIHVYTED